MRLEILGRGLCALAAILSLGACEHFTPTPPSPAQIEADADQVVDDRQIVVITRTATSADALALKATQQGYLLERREHLSGLGLHMLLFTIPEGMTGRSAIRQLEGLEPGISAGVNHAYDLSQGSVQQPRVFAARAQGWPPEGCSSRFPVIGMIDAAADINSSALSGADLVVRSFAASAPGSVAASASSHGTVTAVLLAGPGRLSGARVMNAAVISDHRQRSQVASAASLVLALDWMQASGVRLVNMSLEGPYNRILDRVVQQALARGMIIVASVGNGGPDSAPRYPAAFAGVIGVTALDVANRVYADAAQGAHVDFAAPGVDVFVPVGDRGRYVSGTSVAAPHITALIASARYRDPTVQSIVSDLSRSAHDLGPPGRDTTFGAGAPRLRGGCGVFTQ